MDRKAIARETLGIMERGFYEYKGKQIDIKADMEESVRRSILITPEQGNVILEKFDGMQGDINPGAYSGGERSEGQYTQVENISTVDAIRRLSKEGRKNIGVLNFASAKNPGGGFINGAMAQEESLAASSTLYRTLISHETYYRENRAQSSMIYTDYGIYSPDVVFFRDGRFALTENPVKASVLTLPAVNMGQVMLKGEDIETAKQAMRRRMKLALAIFASQGAETLALGAYGCGVFGNDPEIIALWWKEILEEGMNKYFTSVFYAVLDHSKTGKCIAAFEKQLCS